ncbi:glycosyltransferase family 2 protein [bacterium]|nr:glycosyltransferase family 2 protein [bacterium]
MLLLFVVIPLAYMVLVTVLNALTAPMLSHAHQLRSTPRVSVLVPARNEEVNLGKCLEGLCKQNWPDLEILVLDDNSIDDTWSIIEEWEAKDERVRGLRGSELPDGWLGKPWACQQLAYDATGDILIFTDADNRHAPEAVRNTVGWMQAKRLGFLTAFPQQIVRSLGESLIVPSVDLLVYSLLPMRLTLSMPQPELSAANGQWLAMTKETYQRIGGHAAAKGDVVEDMALVRLAKRLGLRTMTLSGTGVVFGKMYSSFDEVWRGFTKNLFGIAGGSARSVLWQTGMLTSATIVPYFLLFFKKTRRFGFRAVFYNLLIRAVLSVKHKHPWLLVPLHPVAMVLLIGIAFNSLKTSRSGSLRWKGRTITLTSAGGNVLR